MGRREEVRVDETGGLDAPTLLTALRQLPTEELAQTFRELDTLHHSTAAHRLLVLAVLDERGIGEDDGMLDTVGWVTWTSGLTQKRARALVEAARALPERPEIATVALEGRLSDEQLEAVVQVATPESDAEWAEAAPGWTATSLRAAARNRKTVTGEEAVERDRRREVTYRWDERRGELRLRGRIPDADGALVAAALDAAADRYGPVEGGAWDPHPVRCADALVDALSRELDDTSDEHRATVVMHVPQGALHQGSTEPGAHLDADDGGVAIANETARKIACDSKVQVLVVDGKCVPVNMGRRSRTVPNRLFRLLKERDLQCRAPGCTRTRGLHAHHVVHWVDGGPTDLDNLVLLCRRHHTMLHEYGWTIRGKPSALEFAHSDGRPVTPCRPPPLDPATRERLLVSTDASAPSRRRRLR
jgi:hypothetical protein